MGLWHITATAEINGLSIAGYANLVKYGNSNQFGAGPGSCVVTGSLAASGNVSTVGSLTIGTGTPILQHLSTVVNPTTGSILIHYDSGKWENPHAEVGAAADDSGVFSITLPGAGEEIKGYLFRY